MPYVQTTATTKHKEMDEAMDGSNVGNLYELAGLQLKPFTDKVIKELHVLQSVTNSITKNSN